MASLSYPFRVQDGKPVLAVGLLELKHKIIYLLRTRQGERVLRQAFGLPDYVFEASTNIDIEVDITQQILRFNPEVTEVLARATRNESGVLVVALTVSVNGETIPTFSVTLE